MTPPVAATHHIFTVLPLVDALSPTGALGGDVHVTEPTTSVLSFDGALAPAAFVALTLK
ncbi:MAG: hypothetical protein LAO77_25990 [Acidobacteriia bacterium]|nr:hypothetical protein [Terriglobia bacterium]